MDAVDRLATGIPVHLYERIYTKHIHSENAGNLAVPFVNLVYVEGVLLQLLSNCVMKDFIWHYSTLQRNCTHILALMNLDLKMRGILVLY